MTKNTEQRRTVLGAVAAAFVGLAKRAGCSLTQNPMPEVREVGREWRRLDVWA